MHSFCMSCRLRLTLSLTLTLTLTLALALALTLPLTPTLPLTLTPTLTLTLTPTPTLPLPLIPTPTLTRPLLEALEGLAAFVPASRGGIEQLVEAVGAEAVSATAKGSAAPSEGWRAQLVAALQAP